MACNLLLISLGHVHTTNKMKTPDDECGWQVSKQIFMLSTMGVMPLVMGTNSGIFERLDN